MTGCKPDQWLRHNVRVWCNTNPINCYTTTHQYGAMLTGSDAMSKYPRMVQCRLGQLLRHNTHVWRNANRINCYVTLHLYGTMLTRSQHPGMMQ